MKILIAYATVEGQTRKIARFAADELIGMGHSVELLEAPGDDELDIGRFDGAILAGPVHAGKLPGNLADFAKTHARALNGPIATLMVVVSLTAGADDAEDWEGLETLTQAFLEAAGLRPDRVEHVAGAFRFTEYDFFKSWIMKRIAAQKGETVNPNADKELTDWGALRACLADWAPPVAKAG